MPALGGYIKILSKNIQSCCPNLAELNMVTWVSENNEITTAEEIDEDARLLVRRQPFTLTSRSFVLA
jgi:hypothetical protein